MSTVRRGRAMATHHAGSEVPEESAPRPVAWAQPEVIEFIRYCYQRRRIGWPELYDEMCGVAARGEFRGMDYEYLAALGVRFSLEDMANLAALAQRVVQDERRRRVAIKVEAPASSVDAPPIGDNPAPDDHATVVPQ